MLRAAIIALGAACVLGGGVAAMFSGGDSGGWAAMVFGLLLILGTVFERVRYKAVRKGVPGPGWERTTERFVDEESGKTVTVYIRPGTGERMYVEE